VKCILPLLNTKNASDIEMRKREEAREKDVGKGKKKNYKKMAYL